MLFVRLLKNGKMKNCYAVYADNVFISRLLQCIQQAQADKDFIELRFQTIKIHLISYIF